METIWKSYRNYSIAPVACVVLVAGKFTGNGKDRNDDMEARLHSHENPLVLRSRGVFVPFIMCHFSVSFKKSLYLAGLPVPFHLSRGIDGNKNSTSHSVP